MGCTRYKKKKSYKKTNKGEEKPKDGKQMLSLKKKK